MLKTPTLESRYRILGDYIPSPQAWHSVTDALPQSDYDPIMPASRQVLALYSDGHMAVAYVRYDDDPDSPSPPQWVQAGRDAYTDGTVTHWRELPNSPGKD